MRQALQLASGANLGRQGQNTRLRMGMVSLTVGLFASVALTRSTLDPTYRLLTFLPFFMAAFGATQGLFRVCPLHSRTGMRERDDGIILPHEGERRCVVASKDLATKVMALSVVLAGLATGLVYLLPGPR